MNQIESSQEPLRISQRFHQAIKTRILQLELDAMRDELVLPELLCEDHRRRQQKLVRAQRAQAERLRTLLSYACR